MVVMAPRCKGVGAVGARTELYSLHMNVSDKDILIIILLSVVRQILYRRGGG